MTGYAYQLLASRTINKKLHEEDQTKHALFGMCGELGEIQSLFQKEYQGHGAPDSDHLKKEIGDLMWFIAELCTSKGFDLDEVMQMNIEKLKARYPEGFEEEKSLNRQEGDI